jgi:hypothetical protein
MTKIEEKLEVIFALPEGGLFREIHETLVSIGLRAKDNKKTVLYFYGPKANGENSIAAFRVEPRRVFSLPKSYWEPRAHERTDIFSCFTAAELQPPNSSSPSENKSGGQVTVSPATIDRIVNIIRTRLVNHIHR